MLERAEGSSKSSLLRQTAASRSDLIFFLRTTHHDLQRVVGKGGRCSAFASSQGARPDLALFLGGKDHGNRLWIDRRDILPPDFAGGGVSSVPSILMKSKEQARGTPLAGLAVKVTEGFFLVGLSNVDTDRVRNIQLLKERSWFDVASVYKNQRRAILAIEKGPTGELAFNEAFAEWANPISSTSAR
jgi:hypothetical protein